MEDHGPARTKTDTNQRQKRTRMKTIPVEDAVGTVLCHDITRIVPGRCKEPAFRRGHVVRPEDKIGRAHV